jgi:hypothetical protein
MIALNDTNINHIGGYPIYNKETSLYEASLYYDKRMVEKSQLSYYVML